MTGSKVVTVPDAELVDGADTGGTDVVPDIEATGGTDNMGGTDVVGSAGDVGDAGELGVVKVGIAVVDAPAGVTGGGGEGAGIAESSGAADGAPGERAGAGRGPSSAVVQMTGGLPAEGSVDVSPSLPLNSSERRNLTAAASMRDTLDGHMKWIVCNDVRYVALKN